jgi:hypothetical protein
MIHLEIRDSVRIRTAGSTVLKRSLASLSLLAAFGGLVLAPASCAKHAAPATQPAPAPQAASAPAPAPAPPPTAAAPVQSTLPARLSDEEFWKLSSEFSEANGSFRSDNLLSNEVWLQYVIPDLVNVAKAGRVYMGVGPEQNFTYITAVKPAMAVIVDIRRGNLDLHLMYKALFEMSADRADFLSRLFARKRPEGLTATTGVRELFTAYGSAAFDEQYGRETFDAIVDHLKTKHGFVLSDEDVEQIKYVYGYFQQYGPDLTYWMSGGFGGRGGFRNSPTYGDLMVASDASGTLRSYLATPENFAFMKQLETRNMLLPVVGNFAGPKAIRAVGAWLKAHNALVSAFYLSNVEQYLNMDGIWGDFCANAAQLPIDDSSQFIRSYRGGGGPGFGGGSLNQGIFPMGAQLAPCATQ